MSIGNQRQQVLSTSRSESSTIASRLQIFQNESNTANAITPHHNYVAVDTNNDSSTNLNSSDNSNSVDSSDIPIHISSTPKICNSRRKRNTGGSVQNEIQSESVTHLDCNSKKRVVTQDRHCNHQKDNGTSISSNSSVNRSNRINNGTDKFDGRDLPYPRLLFQSTTETENQRSIRTSSSSTQQHHHVLLINELKKQMNEHYIALNSKYDRIESKLDLLLSSLRADSLSVNTISAQEPKETEETCKSTGAGTTDDDTVAADRENDDKATEDVTNDVNASFTQPPQSSNNDDAVTIPKFMEDSFCFLSHKNDDTMKEDGTTTSPTREEAKRSSSSKSHARLTEAPFFEGAVGEMMRGWEDEETLSSKETKEDDTTASFVMRTTILNTDKSPSTAPTVDIGGSDEEISRVPLLSEQEHQAQKQAQSERGAQSEEQQDGTTLPSTLTLREEEEDGEKERSTFSAGQPKRGSKGGIVSVALNHTIHKRKKRRLSLRDNNISREEGNMRNPTTATNATRRQNINSIFNSTSTNSVNNEENVRGKEQGQTLNSKVLRTRNNKRQKRKRKNSTNEDNDDDNGNAIITTTTTQRITRHNSTTRSIKDRTNNNKTSHQVRYDQIWNKKFQLLQKYKQTHGHCCVPQHSKTLGRWVNTQREHYQLFRKNKKCVMTDERIYLLESIGFKWNSHQNQWFQRFEQLKSFQKKHGHTIVSQRRGGKLGLWVQTQRIQYQLFGKKGKRSSMTQERIDLLESVGFQWNVTVSNGMTKAAENVGVTNSRKEKKKKKKSGNGCDSDDDSSIGAEEQQQAQDERVAHQTTTIRKRNRNTPDRYGIYAKED